MTERAGDVTLPAFEHHQFGLSNSKHDYGFPLAVVTGDFKDG